MEIDVGEPEEWLRPYLETVMEKLGRAGYELRHKPFNYLFAAIAAAHISGYDPVYDYVVAAYYDLIDLVEEAEPLATPRWRKTFYELQDEVEALAAFEESLSSSEQVFIAEPILAGAVLAMSSKQGEMTRWYKSGLLRIPGQQVLINPAKKAKILVPRSLFLLAVSGLSSESIYPGSERVAVLPDPAYVRKTILDSHAPLAYFRETVMEAVSKYARLATQLRNDIKKACKTQGVLVIKYMFYSPSMYSAEYLC